MSYAVSYFTFCALTPPFTKREEGSVCDGGSDLGTTPAAAGVQVSVSSGGMGSNPISDVPFCLVDIY